MEYHWIGCSSTSRSARARRGLLGGDVDRVVGVAARRGRARRRRARSRGRLQQPAVDARVAPAAGGRRAGRCGVAALPGPVVVGHGAEHSALRARLPWRLSFSIRGACMPVILVANPKGGVGKSHAGDQHRGLLREPRPCGDAGRRRPPAVVARSGSACARRGARRSATWERRRTATSCGRRKGTTHVGARHAGRPARQALRRGDEAGRQGAGAAAAEHLRHLRDARLPRRAAGAPAQPTRSQIGLVGMRVRRAHARDRPAARVRRRPAACRCSATCATRRTTCSSPRAGSRCSTSRRAACERDLEQWEPIRRWLDA